MAQAHKPKLSREAQRYLQDNISPMWRRAAAALGGSEHLEQEVLLFETYPTRLLLLCDVANLHDDKSAQRWFWRKWWWKIRFEWPDDLLALRDGLKEIWRDSQSTSADAILNEWLRWLPSHAHLLVYQELGIGYKGAHCTPADYASFRCATKACKLFPDVQNLRAMLVQGVLEHAPLLKVCSNPDCAAPYFVAKRRDQVLCDAGPCKAYRQRQHALKWWNQNRAKKASKVTTKKGSTRNVTNKAR
jgi:hypothetical protein